MIPLKDLLGAITGQLQYYGKIGLTNAGDFSQVRVNGDLLLGFDTGCKNKNTKRVEIIFHNLSQGIRVSLLNMCIKVVLAARAADQVSLSKQRTAKIRKE